MTSSITSSLYQPLIRGLWTICTHIDLDLQHSDNSGLLMVSLYWHIVLNFMILFINQVPTKTCISLFKKNNKFVQGSLSNILFGFPFVPISRLYYFCIFGLITCATVYSPLFNPSPPPSVHSFVRQIWKFSTFFNLINHWNTCNI